MTKAQYDKLKIGDKVTATRSIQEANFNGHSRWTHAFEGESGTVVDIQNNTPRQRAGGMPKKSVSVRFERSDTMTVVWYSEIC